MPREGAPSGDGFEVAIRGGFRAVLVGFRDQLLNLGV
jgi:hypothetical protein